MKKIFTRQLLALILLCAFTYSSSAQDEINTEFINRMNYVFSPLEKNRVPHGLLLDYAMEFADLKSYNGVLTDSNKVNAGLLRDIYSTIAMSAIHNNAGGFYSPDYVDSIWQLQRQPGIITLSGTYYNYARLRDDAINSNLITLSSDQFQDRYVSGVWQNPYQTQTVFAMSPPLHAYSGKSFPPRPVFPKKHAVVGVFLPPTTQTIELSCPHWLLFPTPTIKTKCNNNFANADHQ
jgi:hypothetical protein